MILSYLNDNTKYVEIQLKKNKILYKVYDIKGDNRIIRKGKIKFKSRLNIIYRIVFVTAKLFKRI